MKKKNIIMISILIILIIFTYTILSKNKNNVEKPQNVERLEIIHGEKFKYLDELNNKYIIDYQFQDMTNDNLKDDIILLGDRENQSDVYTKGIILIVRDGNTGKFSKYDIKDMEGYECHIELQELTNDNLNEIIISCNKGGKINNRLYNILQFDKNKFKEIFSIKENKGLKIEGKYKDGYVGDIKVEKVKNNMLLDLSDKKEYYLKKQIYDENDKLLNKEAKIMCYPISNIDFITFEDNTVGIKTYQSVIGIDKTDVIDVIECKLKFNKNKFEIFEIESQKIGKLL